MMTPDDRLIARWEASKGKRYLTLYRDNLNHYYYHGDGCGGSLGGTITTEAGAIEYMEYGPVATLTADFPSVKRVA